MILLLGACDSTQDQEPSPTGTDQGLPASTVTQVAMTELLTLVRQDNGTAPGQWHANHSRSTLIYEVRTGNGSDVWAMDGNGEPWLVADARSIETMEFAGVDHVAIVDKNEGNGRNRIRYAKLDGSEIRLAKASRREVRVVGVSGDDLVYAQAGDQAVELLAWNVASEETREIGSFADEFPDVSAPELVGEHVVFESSRGDSRQLVAINVADGRQADVPRPEPNTRLRLVGEAPGGEAIVVESRAGGGSLYTVDLNATGSMTDLAGGVIAETVFLDGSSLRYSTVDGEARLLDLATGEEAEAPSRRREPPGPVVGLEEGSVRLQALLDNGNWLVTGQLVDGAEYRALWDFNEQFGGATSDENISVRDLFEYDPTAQELWQVSGPPTFSSTTTVSGSGSGPDWVLGVAVLDGFVVFSTGFSGAAYDIASNLYASPIPSTLGG